MAISSRRFAARTVVIVAGLILQLWSSRFRAREIVLDGDPQPLDRDWFPAW